MALQKYRWSKDYESAEEELLQFLNGRHIQVTRQTLEPAEEVAATASDTTANIWCAEGSLVIQAADESTLSLQPGDATKLTLQATYTIRAGLTGCVYYTS